MSDGRFVPYSRCTFSASYPLEDPVSRSVTILARTEPSNDSFNVSSVVSSDRPLTNKVLDGSEKKNENLYTLLKVTMHNNQVQALP